MVPNRKAKPKPKEREEIKLLKRALKFFDQMDEGNATSGQEEEEIRTGIRIYLIRQEEIPDRRKK